MIVDEAVPWLERLRTMAGREQTMFFRLPGAAVQSASAHIGRVDPAGLDGRMFKSLGICGLRSLRIGQGVTGKERLCGNCIRAVEIIFRERARARGER